ncbi:MAG: FAD-binding protein [Deltaproteobacteria bacterium]|nr:FAD-binding protein [Deltaproteobacteria bacterium]
MSVTMVDKGYAGRSGQSPYADGFLSFNPDEHNLRDAMDYAARMGEYLNNREFTRVALEECEDRFKDLVSWGVEYYKNDDGSPRKLGPPIKADAYNLVGLKAPNTVRKQAKKVGVEIIDRTMITDLLTHEGRVIGAVGLSIDDGGFLVIHAKATIICTGGSGFKPHGWPIHELTADGDAMAYRVGASITGKEFVDPHTSQMGYNFVKRFSGPKNRPPVAPGNGPKNAYGEEIPSIRTLSIFNEFEIHQGKGPIKYKGTEGEENTIVGGTSSGLSSHKTEGIWPKSIDCDTEIEALFAAGDSLGCMQAGARYMAGKSLTGSAVTGARAGNNSADYAKSADLPAINDNQLSEIREALYQHLDRKGGYSPAWVTDTLQHYMIPYFVTYIKSEKRLEATMTMIEFLRDHMVPKLKANDPHELRQAIETKNMVLNAEMKLRAGLARTESRGNHYREDFPNRDDKLLAWIKLREIDGKMVVEKQEVPKEWLPDNFDSMPYEEKYPIPFLNESREGGK